jgi:uncharacterized membrane protein YphA (DoxX/SURF4 family)
VSGLLRSPRLHLVLRLVLGLYFVYASLDKIADPAAFARIVYQWQVVGPVPSNMVAVVLPWVESVAGLLLIAGVWTRDAAGVVAVMLVVFLVAAGLVLARGIDVDNCGCTSVTAAETDTGWPPTWMRGVGWYLIIRNLLMLAGALVLFGVEPVRGPAPGRAPGEAAEEATPVS